MKRIALLPVLLVVSQLPTTSRSDAATSGADEYRIKSASSRVTFESDAPIENIVGITSAVSGSLSVDLENPSRGAKAKVTVDLRRLQTGVKKRDVHMRSADFLNTKKFPTATFELEALDIKGAIKGKATATGTGTFTLHGVTRTIKVKVKIGHRTLNAKLRKLGFKGDVLRLKGSFAIKLSDYGIKVPSKLGAKVSNTVQISFALTGEAT